MILDRLCKLMLLLAMLAFVGCSNATKSKPDVVAETEEAVEEAGQQAADEAAGETTNDETALVSLSVGDAAPPLRISNWLRGSQVDDFESDRVYIVEFWATWCGPCKAGMPHISELQEQYADQATFVGVTREKQETVEEFLKLERSEGETWDEAIGYTLAVDEDDLTNRNYMQAANQNGIPCAFIVGKDGYIEWIGHPMEIDGPLKEVVDGSWDRAKFADVFEQEQELQAAMMETGRKLQQLVEDEKWDEALEVADGLRSRFPDVPQAAMLRFQVLMTAGRGAEAVTELVDIGKGRWDDPNGLNEIAWMMATNVPEDVRDLDSALEMAERAVELSDDNANIIDTLARVFYERGNLDAAIEWQEKAVALEPSFQRTLDGYLEDRDSESEDESEDSDSEPEEDESNNDESGDE